jgi:hypothetical protein
LVCLGFGGPVTLVGRMERELVDDRKWLDKEGASILLGRIAIGDWLTVLIGLASLAVLFRWNVSNPLLIAATAVVG